MTSDNMPPADGEGNGALVPAVFERDGRVFANSRDVAAFFGKRHDNTLQAIDNLSCSPRFRALNFQETEIKVKAGVAERTIRTVDMTKDGFTFLVMGFTGAKAAEFKERYIEQFNAMEAALKKVNPDALTAKETGGIIKAVVNKALMERVEPLERAMIETARQVQELSHRVDDLLLATNGRVAAVEYVSVRQLLDEAKAIQKGRNSINRKIGRELRDRACLRHPPIPVRKCPHSGVWLFPVDFAAAYMKERGSALVADHNAKVGGQGVIRFPTRRKKPGQPEPDGNRPGA